ncbi:hypothetical protein FGB62_5g144 [Gracilaria domingensis]|nr:hypothetical protein FGB62_5g144 [Gracilaria domingensis]
MIPTAICAGLTLDPCIEQKHCKGNRICRSARTLEICKATSEYCGCVPIDEDKARCDRTSECDAGESCFHPELWQESPACLSDAQIPSIANPKRCKSTEDCVPNRICVFITLVEGYCAIPFTDTENGNGDIVSSEPFLNEEKGRELGPAFIADTQSSENQSFSTEGSDLNASNGSAQSNATTAPSGSENLEEELTEFELGNLDLNEKACVSAVALEHLHPESLLYRKSSYSKVLCDLYGSCATAGHIVYHNSRPMMMKSYCEKTSCVERIMAVNNVKYRRKFRIVSSTPGLYYTAFSARYQTRQEELALAVAVLLGL